MIPASSSQGGQAMKKVLILAVLGVMAAALAYAAQDTDISNREVRDPKKLESWLEANATDAETRLALDESVGVTNVTITSVAPVTNVTGLVAPLTNVTGLAAFATNIVAAAPVTNCTLTLQYGDVVYGEVTNSLLTNVTITVQTGSAPTLQTVTPAVQAGALQAVQKGAAASLTIQR